jgi:hypothetical protein
MDCWISNVTTIVNPGAVVLECQEPFEPDISITDPYKKDFSGFIIHADFSVASLWVIKKGEKKKIYPLIGTILCQYYPFFLGNDFCNSLFPEILLEACFTHIKGFVGIISQLLPGKELDIMVV